MLNDMSKPKSSSFWSSNKTNKVYSQLLYHMFLMAFLLHKINSSFKQNTALQKHITEGALQPFVNFLLQQVLKFEQGVKSCLKIMHTLPMDFLAQICQNSEKPGYFLYVQADLQSDAHNPKCLPQMLQGRNYFIIIYECVSSNKHKESLFS